jgi:hypothetical protein
MPALFSRRIIATSRMTGTETNITRNASPRPKVSGKPRSTRRVRLSRVGSCWRAASVIPSAMGTATARPSQPSRTIQEGTLLGSGTKASANAATLGAITPAASSGHATAAPTSADSSVRSRADVLPNSAWTAHPKIALRILPADRVMSASNA